MRGFYVIPTLQEVRNKHSSEKPSTKYQAKLF